MCSPLPQTDNYILINSDTAACKGATVPVVHTYTPNLCARMQVAPGVANLVGGAVFPVGLIAIFLTGANLYTGTVAQCSPACRMRNGMRRPHSTCARALTSMCDTSQPQLAWVNSWKRSSRTRSFTRCAFRELHVRRAKPAESHSSRGELCNLTELLFCHACKVSITHTWRRSFTTSFLFQSLGHSVLFFVAVTFPFSCGTRHAVIAAVGTCVGC